MANPIPQKLIDMYEQMSELTNPKCATCKPRPYSCCERMYCDLASETISEAGLYIEAIDEQELPYMRSEGCIVPPYLRPLCTMHTCSINAMGFDKDMEWTKEYFKLRNKIDKMEHKVKRL